jgi:hypothetical protein
MKTPVPALSLIGLHDRASLIPDSKSRVCDRGTLCGKHSVPLASACRDVGFAKHGAFASAQPSVLFADPPTCFQKGLGALPQVQTRMTPAQLGRPSC